MYNLSQKNDNNWGIDGYNVPVNNFDYQKIIKEKENLQFAIGKKKRHFKKMTEEEKKKIKNSLNIFTQVEKHSRSVPAPWNYDCTLKWNVGYKNIGKRSQTPKKIKNLETKWLYENKENDKEKFKRIKPEEGKKIKTKEKMKLKKMSYIDDIIQVNTKENYPKPGPGSEYMDEKIIKLVHPKVENKNILKAPIKEIKKIKPKNKKQILEEQKIINERNKKKVTPGPGTYKPKLVDKTFKSNPMTYKGYKNKIKADQDRNKESKAREEERKKDILEKVKFDTKAKIIPIPADYTTFDRINLNKNKVKMKNGFGSVPKIIPSEQELWKKKVECYNRFPVEGKEIDPKKDPMPGPNKYSIISYWPGKPMKIKNKKFGSNSEKLPNILGNISKGVNISIYHKKI